jgi:hypothetical protein
MKQKVEKASFDQLSTAVKQTNTLISSMNLEVSINGCNSFLLDG